MEAFASTLIEVVLDKLVATTPLLDYARRLKVDVAVLQEWRTTLLHLQALLHDAERKQIREKAVKMWLDDLQALAYDIEDVLDEFDAEAREPPQTGTSKVRKLIPSFHPSRGVTFNKKIKQISKELDAIVKRKSNLHLTVEESSVAGGLSTQPEQRLTTSLVRNHVPVRDGDLEKIRELLISDEVATADQVQVIPIVGMGGVGKTTLAQQIYNDERVMNHFGLRVWVCVSDQFDLVGITKAILDDSSTDFATLQSLQQRLQQKLNGKRFFLVLDDIWNENPNSWTNLQAPFKAGAPGSVVLVTTRHEHVAAIMRTKPSHHLTKLSDQDCWSLFQHIAFDSMTPNARRNLEHIGKEIVQKCDGLPLAATTMAGLLRCHQDEKSWKDMLHNEIWNLSTEVSNILPSLQLSYHYLPTHLKRCFAYCSIFPKDYEFQKEQLILLWAAQGFICSLRNGQMIEDAGEEYFQNLLCRSLFLRSPHNSSLFVMHDLIHDLAQFVSGGFCFRLEGEKHKPNSRLTLHASFAREQFKISKKYEPLDGLNKLRTFLPLDEHSGNPICYVANKFFHDLLPKFKCLRVLSLSHYNVTDLPDSFGKDLKHLRYLNLSYTRIHKLPRSIGKLANLQWLMLSNCWRLTQLPPEIGQLTRLHHLDISYTKLECMPIEINRLKDLQRLTTFVVGKDGGAKIKELRDLSHLHGELSILNLQNILNVKDASEANMKEMKNLDELTFVWDPNASDTDSKNDETGVVENLRPHDKLKRLTIQSYRGTEFPKWLENPSFNNLVSLQLRGCGHCRSLPSLGQLQCLEILRFEEMMEWEEWGCGGVEFSCLKELYIVQCPKLKGDMPERLPLLTKLDIWECGELVSFLPMLPSICTLRLDGSNDMMLTSVGSLIPLTSLVVGNACKIPDELSQLHTLVNLHLYGCPKLVEIPPILHNLSSLKCLKIEVCECLSSFSETGLPPMLETLRISSCPNLESLPKGMMINRAPQHLSISRCDSLRSLPINIDSLRSLRISNCKKVELALPEDMMHNPSASLACLYISEACDSLTSFPLGFFPNLEELVLCNCGNLECLYIPHGIQHRGLTSLNYLLISDCPNMVSFPQGGMSAPNLTDLRILHCRKLESLPQRMYTLLKSLQSLWIEDCPEIVSFPEGGLPPSLSLLKINNCAKLMACQKQWRLRTLPSVIELQIKGGKEEIMESLPEEEPFLPSTLTWLEIGDFPNLKSLDEMGVEQLASLQTLRISCCGKLESVPKLGRSLQTLHIDNCEKLESLPKQGLPASLSRLQISRCPQLEKRCQREKGKLWATISHIPCIIFGDLFSNNEDVILS